MRECRAAQCRSVPLSAAAAAAAAMTAAAASVSCGLIGIVFNRTFCAILPKRPKSTVRCDTWHLPVLREIHRTIHNMPC